MLAAEDKGPPPEELRIAWLCKSWSGLPEEGAVLDQDYTLMARMQSLSNIYNAVQKYRSLTGDDINKRLTVSERILLGKLDEMGLLGGIGGG